MAEYKISADFSKSIGKVHHIGVDYGECHYSIVFGRYINGGFFSIPNWGVGGELASSFDDTFWNTESLTSALKDKEAAKAIAYAIKEYSEKLVRDNT